MTPPLPHEGHQLFDLLVLPPVAFTEPVLLIPCQEGLCLSIAQKKANVYVHQPVPVFVHYILHSGSALVPGRGVGGLLLTHGQLAGSLDLANNCKQLLA